MPDDHKQKTRCVILVDDLWRAVRFYQVVLGWKFDINTQAQVAHTSRQTLRDDLLCKSVDGVLRRRRAEEKKDQDEDSYICTFFVKNFDKIAQRILEMNGSPVMEKYHVEGIGWQGYFLDTEGNVFGLLERERVVATW